MRQPWSSERCRCRCSLSNLWSASWSTYRLPWSTVRKARLPHPSSAADAPAPRLPAPGGGDDHDALLRRLRELGELHRSGVLTDEEFTLAKQAVLKRM